MVDHMRSVRPGLKICLSGYDYLNFYDSVLQGNNIAAQAMWLLLGQPSVRQLNDALASLGTYLRSVSNLVVHQQSGRLSLPIRIPRFLQCLHHAVSRARPGLRSLAGRQSRLSDPSRLHE